MNVLPNVQLNSHYKATLLIFWVTFQNHDSHQFVSSYYLGTLNELNFKIEKNVLLFVPSYEEDILHRTTSLTLRTVNYFARHGLVNLDYALSNVSLTILHIRSSTSRLLQKNYAPFFQNSNNKIWAHAIISQNHRILSKKALIFNMPTPPNYLVWIMTYAWPDATCQKYTWFIFSN